MGRDIETSTQPPTAHPSSATPLPRFETTTLSATLLDLAALLFLALAVRLVFLYAVPRVIDSPDAVHYLAAAEHIAQGRFLEVDPKIPILYPAAIALAHQLAGDTLANGLEAAGRLVSLIASTLLVVPLYFLSRTMHGRRTACFTCVLIACWPWIADYGARVSTESLASLIWFIAVYTLWRAVQTPPRSLLAPAIMFLLIHLARPEGTFIALAAFILLAVRFRHTPRKLLPAIFLASTFLTFHALYLRALTGVFTINHRIGDVLENQPEGSTVLADLVKTFNAMLGDVPAVMLGPFLWLFAGAGAIAMMNAPRNHRLELHLLGFALLQWLIVIPNLSPAPRYIMVTLIAVLCWSARGLAIAGDGLAAIKPSPLARYAPLALILLLFAYHAALTIALEHRPGLPPRHPVEYKSAGLWMREHLEPGLVMTRKPQIAFYARMPSSGPALNDSIETILEKGQTTGFSYLVIDERHTAQLVPALAPLLDPRNAPPSLTLLNANASPYPAARVVVYAFPR